MEKALGVLTAFAHGDSPDAEEVRLLNEQARHPQAASNQAKRRAAVAAGALDPDALTNADDTHLDAIFRASGTLGIERLVNSGVRKVDPVRHEIYNDAYWKGYLPKGLPLGQVASQIYSGYYKRFWREGDRNLGETRYLDGRVPVAHTLEEVTIDRGVGDMVPGRYILLHYDAPVFENLFYDVMKIVSEDVVLYRGYVGRFPDGRRGWTAPLLRRYKFAQMDADDHSSLFQAAPPATGEHLPGTWRLDVVANSNHASGVGELHVERGADGTIRGTCEPGPAFKSAPLPGFVLEHFRVDDFRQLLGEIREIDRGVLIGRWMTSLRKADDGSLGLFQTAEDGRGQKRLALYYLLNRIG